MTTKTYKIALKKEVELETAKLNTSLNEDNLIHDLTCQSLLPIKSEDLYFEPLSLNTLN